MESIGEPLGEVVAESVVSELLPSSAMESSMESAGEPAEGSADEPARESADELASEESATESEGTSHLVGRGADECPASQLREYLVGAALDGTLTDKLHGAEDSPASQERESLAGAALIGTLTDKLQGANESPASQIKESLAGAALDGTLVDKLQQVDDELATALTAQMERLEAQRLVHEAQEREREQVALRTADTALHENEHWKATACEELRLACQRREIGTLQETIFEGESVGLTDAELAEPRAVMSDTRRRLRLEAAIECHDEEVLEMEIGRAQDEGALEATRIDKAVLVLERIKWRRVMPHMPLSQLLEQAPYILKAKVDMDFLATHMFERFGRHPDVPPEDLAGLVKRLRRSRQEGLVDDDAQKCYEAAEVALLQSIGASEAQHIPDVVGWERVVIWLDLSGRGSPSAGRGRTPKQSWIRKLTGKEDKVELGMDVLLSKDPFLVALKQFWELANSCARGGCSLRCLATGLLQDTGQVGTLDVKVGSTLAEALTELIRLVSQVKDAPLPLRVSFAALRNALGGLPPGDSGALFCVGVGERVLPLATIRASWGFERAELLGAVDRETKRPVQATTDWDRVPAFKRRRL